MKNFNYLNPMCYENKFLPTNIVGSYHSGNGKRPNTRQPNYSDQKNIDQ